MKTWFLTALIIGLIISVKAQSDSITVGGINIDKDKVQEGYTLFYPHNQSTTYLIDNCGQIVHSWEDSTNYRPGNAAYLNPDGTLVRCKRQSTSGPNDFIWAGGGGETVEIRSWDNELLNSFTLNDSSYRLHHDVAVLPDGNIIMIAWERIDSLGAIALGRDPGLLPSGELWSEALLEWNPVEDSIVWEWHVTDHIIQDYDASLSNYGNPLSHPELININYQTNDGNADWLHINSIDYNPVLDQIVISVPTFDELWIIDHSTTTTEATTGLGGESNKGGNLLYRWGNARAIGSDGETMCHFQHDVRWIDPNAGANDINYGKISLFNNRVSEGLSTGNTLQTPVDAEGNYEIGESYYGPLQFENIIVHPDTISISYSTGLSSFQTLDNGNYLICAGRWGYLYEMTAEGAVVWEYIVPLKGGTPVEQGTSLEINNNITFRATKYPIDYSAFEGKDLTVKSLSLETGTDITVCERELSTPTNEAISNNNIAIYPNPVHSKLNISTAESPKAVHCFDIHGRLIKTFNEKSGELDLSDLNTGIYFIQIIGNEFNWIQKIVKE